MRKKKIQSPPYFRPNFLVQAPLTETVVAQKFLQNNNKIRKTILPKSGLKREPATFPRKQREMGCLEVFGQQQILSYKIRKSLEDAVVVIPVGISIFAFATDCNSQCWFSGCSYWCCFLTAQNFKPRKTKMATVHSNSHFNKDNLQDTWNARGKLAVDVTFALDVAGHS